MLETVQKASSRSSRKNQDRFKISPTSASMMTERDVSEKDKQACWTLMSRSERVLLVLLVLTVIVLIAACIVIAYLFITAQNVCESPSCIKASSQLIETADFSIDPCDDFYQFVCGNYIPNLEDCEGEARLRKDAVGSALLEEDSSGSLAVAKQFYQACTDVDEENRNSTALLSLFSQVGGWPLTLEAKWRENGFHWLNFMVALRSEGFKYDWLINLDCYEDADGKNLLLIAPPDLKPETGDIYLQKMVAVGVALGASNARAWDEFLLVHELEEKLAKINRIAQSNLEKEDNQNYVQKTVKELNANWPTIKLTDVLNKLAGGYAHFDSNTTVVVASTYYLRELILLLMETRASTQANYMIWKIIESFLPFASDDLRAKYSGLPDRKDQCLSETTRRFYSGLQAYVGTNKKSVEIEESVALMTDLIKIGVGDGVEDMKVDIKGINNPNITESLSIMNMINEVNKWSENAFYNCLHKKSICSKEGNYNDLKHLEINFDFPTNTIEVPLFALHSDWYRWNQPNYINYARLGRTLADGLIDAKHKKNKDMEGDEISGVDLAYTSYQEWIRREGKERNLPAIDYSINQLFWIHSTSMYCSSTNDSSKFDEVTNSTYFRKDFNCKSLDGI